MHINMALRSDFFRYQADNGTEIDVRNGSAFIGWCVALDCCSWFCSHLKTSKICLTALIREELFATIVAIIAMRASGFEYRNLSVECGRLHKSGCERMWANYVFHAP